MGTQTKLRIRRRRRRSSRPGNPFLDGIASIFDFTGSLRTHTVGRHPPEAADRQAIWNDCTAIGRDFRAIIGDWEHLEFTGGESTDSGRETNID